MPVYECEGCEAELQAGMTFCPRCGEAFDVPVPDEKANFEQLADPRKTQQLPPPSIAAPLLASQSLEPPPILLSPPSQRDVLQTSEIPVRKPDISKIPPLAPGTYDVSRRSAIAPVAKVETSLPTPKKANNDFIGNRFLKNASRLLKEVLLFLDTPVKPAVVKPASAQIGTSTAANPQTSSLSTDSLSTGVNASSADTLSARLIARLSPLTGNSFTSKARLRLSHQKLLPPDQAQPVQAIYSATKKNSKLAIPVVAISLLAFGSAAMYLGEVKVTENAPIPRWGWVVTASTQGDTNSAIDGLASSRWTTRQFQEKGQWFDVDLGSQWNFNRIDLDASGSVDDYPRNYEIYVSPDGNGWGKPIARGTGHPGILVIKFNRQSARYIRIMQTGKSSDKWWSIHDLNIYNVARWFSANNFGGQQQYQLKMLHDKRYASLVIAEANEVRDNYPRLSSNYRFTSMDFSGRYRSIQETSSQNVAWKTLKPRTRSKTLEAKYDFQDIGNFQDEFTYHQAAMNNQEQIVGSIQGDHDEDAPNHDFQAIMWQKGIKKYLGLLPSFDLSIASSINNAGQIVGYCSRRSNKNFDDDWWYWPSQAFIWQTGKMHALGILTGFESSAATAINDHGVIVGRSYNTGHQKDIYWWAQHSHACMWVAGKVRDLGMPKECILSRAYGINNRAQVVGWGVTRDNHMQAVLWDGSKIVNLGTLPGGTVSAAFAINDQGQIVGSSQRADGDVHACLWQDGKAYDLGTLAGFNYSKATAINDQGQVLGFCGPDQSRGFLWDASHGIQDLADVCPAAPMTMQRAYAITNDGKILGLANKSEIWDKHFFVLTAHDRASISTAKA